MFTRIVELTSKPGKNKQLADTIDEKVLPILKKQKGFVDETVFVSDKEDNRVLAQGFWNTKEDAEEYHRAEYQKVHETIRHLLESEPVIRTFNVHSSTKPQDRRGQSRLRRCRSVLRNKTMGGPKGSPASDSLERRHYVLEKRGNSSCRTRKLEPPRLPRRDP